MENKTTIDTPEMITEKSWKEFRDSGLLWTTNSYLQTFGWSICLDIDDKGNVCRVFPARTKFRGFSNEINDDGYRKLTEYIHGCIDELIEEANLN